VKTPARKLTLEPGNLASETGDPKSDVTPNEVMENIDNSTNFHGNLIENGQLAKVCISEIQQILNVGRRP